MIIALFAMAVQTEQPVVRTTELVPATPWVEVISGSCGGHRLEVRRPMRPLLERPAVILDGAQVSGADTLERELSEVRAAYRFSIQCAPSNTMLLRWVSGLAGTDGQIAYRAGFAFFRDGLLTEAQSEDSTAESFWYR